MIERVSSESPLHMNCCCDLPPSCGANIYVVLAQSENRMAIRMRLYRKLPPTYDKAVTYKLLDELPRDKLCTRPPWEDSELQQFRDHPVSHDLAGAKSGRGPTMSPW